MFSSCLCVQKNESVVEEVKSRVFFYGFIFEKEINEKISLSIPISLLAKKRNNFSVYDPVINWNANYFKENNLYVFSNFDKNPLNNFSSIKIDSFNPYGVYSVESAIGLRLFNTFLGLLVK